jgi:hypothetical protein
MYTSVVIKDREHDVKVGTHFQGTGWIVPFDLREWN